MLTDAMPKAVCPKPRKVERRSNSPFGRLRRVVWAWLFDNDMDTLQKLLVSGQFALAFAILALHNRIIATPPPYLQNYVLTLPAWLWTLLLVGGVCWQIQGRRKRSFCVQRNASLFALFVCGSLVGPLALRGPGLCIMVVFGVVYQTTLAARFWRLCEVEQEGC